MTLRKVMSHPLSSIKMIGTPAVRKGQQEKPMDSGLVTNIQTELHQVIFWDGRNKVADQETLWIMN